MSLTFVTPTWPLTPNWSHPKVPLRSMTLMTKFHENRSRHVRARAILVAERKKELEVIVLYESTGKLCVSATPGHLCMAPAPSVTKVMVWCPWQTLWPMPSNAFLMTYDLHFIFYMLRMSQGSFHVNLSLIGARWAIWTFIAAILFFNDLWPPFYFYMLRMSQGSFHVNLNLIGACWAIWTFMAAILFFNDLWPPFYFLYA